MGTRVGKDKFREMGQVFFLRGILVSFLVFNSMYLEKSALPEAVIHLIHFGFSNISLYKNDDFLFDVWLWKHGCSSATRIIGEISALLKVDWKF